MATGGTGGQLPSSHYQAMKPISGGAGEIYQNTALAGHAQQRSVGGGGGFHPIYGTTGGSGAIKNNGSGGDDGNHSDYVCMLAGSASASMDGGMGVYQPIFGTSASLINDTPVKVQAYKADSVSIQQFPTASTAVAASQPKAPPPAMKKPESTKPKVNPLAASDAALCPPPQRRTPSLPPSSPTPSNLSSGSGSGRGE